MEIEMGKIDVKILHEAKRVARKLSQKRHLLQKAAHRPSRKRKRSSTLEHYRGRKILAAYERNLPDYIKSAKRAMRL